MKILIMNWRDHTNPVAGGAELVTHEIAKRWIRWGNEVRLLTSKYPSASEEDIIDGVAVTRVGGRFSVYLSSAYRFLREYHHSYDVVVDQINSVPFLTPLYSKVPIVSFVFQMTRDIYHRELPKFLSSIAVGLEPFFLRLYANHPAIVLSESTKRDLLSIGFPSDSLFVCPPGVDHDNFEVGEKTDYPSVLYLNRFARYKNLDFLIAAFREVLQAIPNCILTAAGARTQGEIHSFRKLSEELGIQDSVRILPFVDGGAKVKLLQESWLHVLPSMREGWGISILEAAACGTPTAGFDVPGIRDAIQHMKTGLLVGGYSMKALSSTIVGLLQDEELRNALSKSATDWAKGFTWNLTAEKAAVALHKARRP